MYVDSTVLMIPTILAFAVAIAYNIHIFSYFSGRMRIHGERRKAIVDDDTGDTVYKEKTVGVCEVTDVGKNTSSAKLVSGKAKLKDVLRFYENAEQFAVSPAPSAAPAKEIAASPFPRKKQRIAVAPFFSKQNVFSVYGIGIESRTWMDDVADHLNIFLTQTDSFKVLDRSFGPEIDRELNRIVNDPNASPNDVCRLSNKLATDYLVVADVMFSDVASPGVNFATGLPLPPPSVVFAEIRFRCVVAPTTQIAWADIVRMDAAHVERDGADMARSVDGAHDVDEGQRCEPPLSEPRPADGVPASLHQHHLPSRRD